MILVLRAPRRSRSGRARSWRITGLALALVPALVAAWPAAAVVRLAHAENWLVPEREHRVMGDRDVDGAGVRFRPGKGLEVKSRDGAYSLRTGVRVQLLYTLLDQEGADLEQSFQLRRARVAFKGNLFGKHNKFDLELALSPRDLGFKDGVAHHSPLLSCFFDFDYLRDLTVRVGQFKVPFNRQRLISSANLQLVDRSVAQGEFNLDRDVGVELHSLDVGGANFMRYYAGIFLGDGRDSFAFDDFGLMYVARIELLPAGMFDDQEEADFSRSLEPRLSIGAAYAFVDDAKVDRGITGSAPKDGGTTDYHVVTADLHFKFAGMSLLAEFYWREGRRNPGDAKDEMGVAIPIELPRNGYGAFVQLGYLVPRVALEVAARYSRLGPIDVAASSLEPEEEAGAGVSYYFGHHAFKIQADYFRLWGAGGLASGDHQLRIQLQASM